MCRGSVVEHLLNMKKASDSIASISSWKEQVVVDGEDLTLKPCIAIASVSRQY